MSLDQWLLGAPAGFGSSISAMNSMSAPNLEALIGSVMTEHFSAVTVDEDRAVSGAISYLHRGVVEHKVDAAELKASLGMCTEASGATVEILVRLLTGTSEPLARSKSAFNIGQLTNLEWKLGVAVASSQCNALLTPFVSLELHVSDTNGETRIQTVELTYSEFQTMSKTMTEVASKLDRL